MGLLPQRFQMAGTSGHENVLEKILKTILFTIKFILAPQYFLCGWCSILKLQNHGTKNSVSWLQGPCSTSYANSTRCSPWIHNIRLQPGWDRVSGDSGELG